MCAALIFLSFANSNVNRLSKLFPPTQQVRTNSFRVKTRIFWIAIFKKNKVEWEPNFMISTSKENDLAGGKMKVQEILKNIFPV